MSCFCSCFAFVKRNTLPSRVCLISCFDLLHEKCHLNCEAAFCQMEVSKKGQLMRK